MPLKNAIELFIVLLYSNNCQKITGSTRLMKLMFLLLKEAGFDQFENELNFESFNFGPFSSEVFADYPKTLEELGVLQMASKINLEIDPDSYLWFDRDSQLGKKMISYQLTIKGIEVGKVYYERLSGEEKSKIDRIKHHWNNTSLNNLITYVYATYIEFTDKSKIKDTIFTKWGVSKNLIDLIGILPKISLGKEKEMIAESIQESFF